VTEPAIVDWEPDGGEISRIPAKDRVINQIDKCVELLKRNGHTRRAQAVTWQAWNDLGISDPACLQRLWFRVQREDGKDKLNMTVHMRSNDAYRAAYMNMYAFTELQKLVADQVGVPVGEYIHISDSFHLYGSYFDEFKNFLNMTENREEEDLVYNTSDALPFFVMGCDTLLSEEKMPKDKKQKVRARKAYLESIL
jgi:thymidylate synthase